MANPVYSSKFLQQMVDPLSSYGPAAQECISEATINFASALGVNPTAECIENALKTIPSWQAQSQFEYHLCDVMGRKRIAAQADLFKNQFEKTGLITHEEMKEAYLHVDKIFSGNGKFSGIPNAKQLLLTETLRQVEHIGVNQRNASQMAASMAKSFFYGKSATTLLNENRVQTIAQLKLALPTPMESTTAPVIGENDQWLNREDITPEEIVFEPAVMHVQTSSIYPKLAPSDVNPIQPGRLYPGLPSNEVILVVTDSGTGLHFRSSYINHVFSDFDKQGRSDQETWDLIPLITQRDALRHCVYLPSCSGGAEELACRLFKGIDELKMQLRFADLGLTSFKNPELSAKFVKEGEELLELYYFKSYPDNSCLDFYDKFKKLQPEGPFLQYFYEMAIAVGIQIESWDRQFAENHWKRLDMIHLSVQALEKCLHTKKG